MIEGLLEDSFILGVAVEAAGRRRYGWLYRHGTHHLHFNVLAMRGSSKS
jgi:hypothetical protein